MYTLKHHAARLALDVQNAFVAQHLLAIQIDERADVAIHFAHVKRPICLDHEACDFIVMLVIAVGQKIGLDFEDRVQIEATNVQQILDRRDAKIYLFDRRTHIQAAQALHELLRLVIGGEIGLGHQQTISKRHLLLCFRELFKLGQAVFRVNDGDDCIKQVTLVDFFVGEKSLRNRCRVSHAGRLNHYAVKLELALGATFVQAVEDADQITAHCAADAAVVHLNDLLFAVGEDFVVDALFAEFILNHRNFFAVRFFQDAVKQRGFTSTQKAGQDGDWNRRIGRHGPP